MTMREFLEMNMGKHVKVGFSMCFIFCDVVTPDTEAEIMQEYRNFIATQKNYISDSTDLLHTWSDPNYLENKVKASKEKIKKLEEKIKQAEEQIKEMEDPVFRKQYEEKLAKSKKGLPLDIRIHQAKNRIKTCQYAIKSEKEFLKTGIEDIRDQRDRMISYHTERIKNCQRKLKELVPFLDVESNNIYTGMNGEQIFTSEQNSFVEGAYWDEDEYRNKFRKGKRGETDAKILDDVDSLLKFFASPYAESLCGKVDPAFIVKQLLEADIYLS